LKNDLKILWLGNYEILLRVIKESQINEEICHIHEIRYINFPSLVYTFNTVSQKTPG
jgi:hypothetical protein